MFWLFDTTGFVTRSHCGAWPTGLSTAYQAATLSIGLAYLWISGTLARVWWTRRAVIKHHKIIAVFAAFIFFCGLTHFADWLVFRWAGYRLFTANLAVTAFFSAWAAGLVGPAYKLSRDEVHEIRDQWQQERTKAAILAQELKIKNRKLEGELIDLQSVIRRRESQDQMIEKTRQILAVVRGINA